jgi:glycosyltransferase involved in cell wall biosynthesis
MKEGYIPQEQRKKILLLCDDIRMTSGISTMAREIVVGTAHHFNWVNLGGGVNHPEEGKKMDICASTNEYAKIEDASVFIYPVKGYGTIEYVKQIMHLEKPDAIMIFTDPRYWIWLFQFEHELRKQVPLIYLNIWDSIPYPMYNKSYYESCDALFAISKQTENINRVVLGDVAEEKVIKYVPHGINEDHFYPIDETKPEYLALQEYKKQLFSEKEYDFSLLYNARNIRRKSVPDLMLGWKLFLDTLSPKQADKVCLVMHTQPKDEHGSDLIAVKEMLFGRNDKSIIISQGKQPVQVMNLLYNSCDATILPSSNEGWGLSLTEAMMVGKPIIATVTGGMQDQMRFEDENGKWIKFTPEFGSNHRGKYKNCGKWAFPIFPNNLSLVGSQPTPYIFDDRITPEDIAEQISVLYGLKTITPQNFEERGKAAREWVTSDESMMSARWMSKNVISGIEETLEKFQPRYSYELIHVKTPEQPLNYNPYLIAK